MGNVYTSRRSPQAVPVDAAALWEQSQRILFAVARKVRLSVRLKLEGHGRGEAEAEELVNDAFLTLLDALPRFNPATAKLTTFVYGLARRRMWLVARAEFYGVSPEEMHRLDARKRSPYWHHGTDAAKEMAAPEEDAGERQSVRRVDAIRRRLPVKDRCLIDLYLREGGNYSAVARCLNRDGGGIRGRYQRLFRRVAATA